VGGDTFFFGSDLGDFIADCIDLALLYKVDPVVMLGRSPAVIAGLYDHTLDALKRMKEDD
jgi:hypothetical protein